MRLRCQNGWYLRDAVRYTTVYTPVIQGAVPSMVHRVRRSGTASYSSKVTTYDTVTRILMGVKMPLWGRKSAQKENSEFVDEFEVLESENEFVKAVIKYNNLRQYQNIVPMIQTLFESKKVISGELLSQVLSVAIEVPVHGLIEAHIDDLPFEPVLKLQIQTYFDIVKIYLPYMANDQQFQEIAIQLCYHVGNLEILNDLSDLYLKNGTFNHKTLCYIIAGNAGHFNIESAKKYFGVITHQSQDLDVKVLESSLQWLIKSGALFENLTAILQTWIFSRNPLPSARAMASVLSQAQKYGTLEELHEIEALVNRYGLHTHYLVKIVQLKNKITNRHRNSFKKEVLLEDVKEVEAITNKVHESGTTEELKECYCLLMSFFTRYTTLASVKFVLGRMKEHEIPIDETIRELLIRNYLIHEKYLSLVGFVKNIRQKFTPEVFLILFEAFVRSHPYYAKEYQVKFTNFIKGSSLDEPSKTAIISQLKIDKIDSHVRPYVFGDNKLNPKKYDSDKWQFASSTKTKSKKSQIRIIKGFDELIERGVKPDMRVLEQAFRNGSLRVKTAILDLAPIIRMQPKEQNRLSMINLQFASDEELRKFMAYNKTTLNNNNRIALSRILSNRKMWEDSLTILNSVNTNELTDVSRMVVLSFKLLPLYLQRDFSRICQEVGRFPVDTIALSPYLTQKLGQFKNKLVNYSVDHPSVEVQECIERLEKLMEQCENQLETQRRRLEDDTREMFEYFAVHLDAKTQASVETQKQ